LVFVVLVTAVWTRDWRWLLAAPVVGYGLSWLGPLAGDFVMFKDILLGRLRW
jgi:hypothetical protein